MAQRTDEALQGLTLVEPWQGTMTGPFPASSVSVLCALKRGSIRRLTGVPSASLLPEERRCGPAVLDLAQLLSFPAFPLREAALIPAASLAGSFFPRMRSDVQRRRLCTSRRGERLLLLVPQPLPSSKAGNSTTFPTWTAAQPCLSEPASPAHLTSG